MCARDVHQARKARPQRRHGRLLRFLLLLDDVDDVGAVAAVGANRQAADDAFALADHRGLAKAPDARE